MEKKTPRAKRIVHDEVKTETITFDDVEPDPVFGFKSKLIGITYYSG
jgi:hypothetical protein